MDAMQAGHKEPGVEHNFFGASKKSIPFTRHFPLTSSPIRVSSHRLGYSLFRFHLVLIGSGLDLVLTSLTKLGQLYAKAELVGCSCPRVLHCHTPPFMEVVGQEGLMGPFQLLLSTHGPRSAYNISLESNYG